MLYLDASVSKYNKEGSFPGQVKRMEETAKWKSKGKQRVGVEQFLIVSRLQSYYYFPNLLVEFFLSTINCPHTQSFTNLSW